MIANHKGEIPFVILLLPFVAGIALALNLPYLATTAISFILLVCLSTIFIVLNISYKKLNIYKFSWAGGVLIHALLFLSGWVCVINYNELNKPDHFSRKQAQYLAIKIINEPVIKNGLIRFAACVNERVDSSGNHSVTTGKLLVTIKDSAAFTLNYGNILLIPAKYNPVDPPYNPAEFNYKQYLAHQNIYHQAYLYPRQYVVMVRTKGNLLISYALQLRKKLIARFEANMHDSSAIAVASTMILGYKADLSEDVLQAYTKTGTLHVLSVSGAHVAIVFILLSWTLSFFNRVRYGKIVKTFIIIVLIWAYALLTGFSPAACRAALMISLIIGGNNFYRYINPLNLLAASAFALLLYDPFYLVDVGFQLSYLAVGGLIVFQPVLYKSIQISNKWLDKLWALCSVSIAAQVITFPPSAFYFHQFPVYFLVSNIFVLLPVVAIMYLGVAFLLLSRVPVLGSALGYLLEKIIILMNKGLAVIENLPFAAINKLWITTFEYTLLYGVIVLIFYFLYNRNKRLLNWALALTLFLATSVAWKKIDSRIQNSITFLNLRKQRAIVFKSGYEAVVLSDLKPSDKNYKYAVQPGLDSSKIEKVKVYSFDQNIDLPFIKKRGNLIRFYDKNLIIVDSSKLNLNLNRQLKTDYAYVTRMSPASLKKINQNFSTGLLVISADNSDRYVDSIKKRLSHCNKKFYLLKGNKSLNLNSN